MPWEDVEPFSFVGLHWPAEQAFSTTFYVEARSAGEFRLQLELREPGWGMLDSDPVIFTALAPDGEVKLTIFDGQDGAEVKDEDGGGAVTVANMNDTDGDGIIDNVDHTGGASGGNGVEETRTGDDKHGRNEVDLMQLIVHKPKPYTDTGGPVVLTATPANRVRLWGDKLKKTAIDAAYDPETGVATWAPWGGGGDRTIWVEITSASSTVADVELKLEYSTFDPDIVKATGVWSTMTLLERTTTTWAQHAGSIWDTEMDEPLQKLVEKYGGTGVRPIAVPIGPVQNGVQPVHFANVVLFQFTVEPNDVEQKLPRVKFDPSRQRKVRFWTVLEPGQNPVVWQPNDPDFNSDFPIEYERPNDGGENDDEGNKAFSNGHFYDEDTPGVVVLSPSQPSEPQKFIQKANFWEFMRVAFKGVRPSGNQVKGSQASPNYKWHSIVTVDRSTGAWLRTAGGANEIEPQWTDIGEQP